MSGSAGPVIKKIGINESKIENIETSRETDLPKIVSLNGRIKFLNMILGFC